MTLVFVNCIRMYDDQLVDEGLCELLNTGEKGGGMEGVYFN